MNRHLPSEYVVRPDNAQSPNLPSDIVHQHQVYELLVYLVSRGQFRRVIDIGSGSGRKLTTLASKIEIICLDRPDMRPLVAQHLPNAQFIECDLEAGLPHFEFDLSDTVIMCSDVVEHLREPEVLIRQLADLSTRCPYLLISAPDRVRTRGLLDMGPPADPAHTMEWTADEFGRLMVDCGFPLGFLLGYTLNNDQDLARNTILAVSGCHAVYQSSTPTLRAAAILHTYNEADIIESTVKYLNQQSLEVHVIDNWSNDGTHAILTRLHREGFCANVSRFPDEDPKEFNLQAQLRHTSEYASRLPCDWIIHYDTDEFRSAPWPRTSLAEAITFVDRLGYTAIDFTVLNFVFVDDHSPLVFSPNRLKFFDFARHPAHKVQIKAWKNQRQIVNLADNGGHVASFDGMRIFPLKFLTKHYPFRSVTQSMTKIHRDRLPRIERERRESRWHSHYDTYRTLHSVLPWRKHEALNFDPNVFPAEYLVERISGVGIETEERTIPNISTIFEYLDAQAPGETGQNPVSAHSGGATSICNGLSVSSNEI